MPTKKTTDSQIDSQKIRLIPQLIDGISQLHQLIVTGNLATGEPGLLESVRKIRDDVSEIKNRQESFAELERRVREIEERHKRIDEERKKMDAYKFLVIGTLITNIGIIIMSLLGLGK